MVANLNNFQVKDEYFLLGGLRVVADINCDNQAVKFKKQLESGFYSDFVPNGDEFPVAIAVLYSEEELAFLELTKEKPEILIKRNIEARLTKIIRDLVVYGGKAYGQRCDIFEVLRPQYKNLEYMQRQLNKLGEKQFSMNRCGVTYAAFIPDIFRLGTLTPGSLNDCQLTSYKFENTMINIIPDLIVERPIDFNQACSSRYEPQYYESIDTDLVVEDIKRMKMRNENDECNLQLRDDSINEMTDKLLTSKIRSKSMGDNSEYIWSTTDYFKMEWIEKIENENPGYMPINYLKNNRNVKTWFIYIEEKNRFKCRLCSEYYDNFYLARMFRPDLANDIGVEITDDYLKNKNLITRHYDTAAHTAVVSELKRIALISVSDTFDTLQQKSELDNIVLAATTRVFRTVYAAHLTKTSFNSYRYLIDLQRIHNIKLGKYYGNRDGVQEMTSSISQRMHKILIEYILKENRPISIIMDTSVDLNKVNYLSVLLQTIEDERPTVYFYRLISLRSAGTGEGIFNSVKNALNEDKLLDYFKKNLVGYNTDGDMKFRGEKNGVLGYFRRFFEPRKFLAIHCMCHRLELALHHSMKKYDWYNGFENTLNTIHNFYYSHSHKRLEFLREMADNLNLEFYELHAIYQVIWKLIIFFMNINFFIDTLGIK